MNIMNNPEWIKEFIYSYESVDEIPDTVFRQINQNLKKVVSEQPVVSVVIPAWNEERNILSCIASLAKSKTSVPFEILLVNNNSTDRTQEIIDKLDVRSVFQAQPGTGPARQLGQEHALGEYILTGDADCIYPEKWVDIMYHRLNRKGVVCVYGRYSFIGDRETPRWQLFIYEKMKDFIAEIRHVKRPYLNSLTLSMGYIRQLGLQVGYDMRGLRGDDGRLVFDLMSFGKIVQVRSDKCRIWTGQRTLRKDGSLARSFYLRFKNEISKLYTYLYPHPPHDTKTSKNS